MWSSWRGDDRLNWARERLQRHGRRILALRADTTDDVSVREVVTQAAEELGESIFWSTPPPNPAGPMSRGRWPIYPMRSCWRSSTRRCSATCAAPGPPRAYMVRQGWGRIVNISGLAARRSGLPSGSIRNVAVAALTKNLVDELGLQGSMSRSCTRG